MTPILAAFIVLAAGALIFLGVSHYYTFSQALPIGFMFATMFVSLSLNAALALSYRHHIPLPGFEERSLNEWVSVVIPVYNEDPKLLSAGLRSLADQSRKPDQVFVVDDGSDEDILAHGVIRIAVRYMEVNGIEVTQIRQENAGKRFAQAAAFTHPEAVGTSIWLTIDSDTVLDSNAVRELMVPFQNPKVFSVAGVAYGQNHKANFLTRVIELGFAMSFLSGRAAEGAVGAVRVNCGVIGAYRSEAIIPNLDRYLGQTFLGSPATSGDDRALTIFARELGRTEFQSTAVAYSALPINLSHLVRQRVRWARSWFWGAWWLLGRPYSKPEFWLTLLQIFALVSYFLAIITLFVLVGFGILSWIAIPATIAISAAIGLVSNFRYVILGRRDESVWDRIGTWLLSPVSTLLYMFILTPLYLYGGLTLNKKSWGTRGRVEVELHD